MKKSNTRRSLLLSALSLLMCVSMLIGSTFAWFTDEVKSGINKIEAGNLDIELYHGKGEPTNKVDESTKDIFTDKNGKDILWEPGVVAWTNLKVDNKGSLALKYQLAINFDNATTNAKGETLAKVLKVGFVTGGIQKTDRADVLAEVTQWKELASFVQTGTLDAENHKNDIYGIVIYWEPSAIDNDFNLNNGQTGKMQIDLGLKLIATQKDAEFDSFGNDYDKDAVYYDTLVTNAEELYAAVASASADTVIAIDGNIVLDKALSKAGLKDITFVAYDEDATIDQATYNMHFAGAKVTFNGLTLTHGEKAYGNGGQTSTAFAVWDAKEVNYIDCTFNRSVGTIHASLHNFIGCTFNGVENPNNTKSEYPLYICDGQDYNVVDCVFNCTNRGAILFYNDGGSGTDTLNISNTKFLGTIIADKTAVEIHNNSTTQTYNVNIKDVVVGDKIANGLYRVKPANVGQVNVTEDGVTNVATASTATDLSTAYNAAQPGDTIYLNADISVAQFAFNKEDVTVDLNGQELTTANNYGGATVSNGASIKNGTINHTGNTAAIKISGEAGTIENVTINMTPTAGKTKTGIQVYNGKYVEAIKNVTITGTTQGIEVAKGSRVDLIENVTVKAIADGDKKGVALLVNAASVGKAVNCTFEGDYGVYMMLNGEFHVGLELVNCTVTGATAAVIAHDEAGTSNTTNCSLTLAYDADTKINGEFVWNFEEECQSVVTLNKP